MVTKGLGEFPSANSMWPRLWQVVSLVCFQANEGRENPRLGPRTLGACYIDGSTAIPAKFPSEPSGHGHVNNARSGLVPFPPLWRVLLCGALSGAFPFQGPTSLVMCWRGFDLKFLHRSAMWFWPRSCPLFLTFLKQEYEWTKVRVACLVKHVQKDERESRVQSACRPKPLPLMESVSIVVEAPGASRTDNVRHTNCLFWGPPPKLGTYQRRAEHGFGEYSFEHRNQRVSGPDRVLGWELSEFLSAEYLCAKANSTNLSEFGAELSEFLFRNSSLKTVFRPLPSLGRGGPDVKFENSSFRIFSSVPERVCCVWHSTELHPMRVKLEIIASSIFKHGRERTHWYMCIYIYIYSCEVIIWAKFGLFIGYYLAKFVYFLLLSKTL